MREIKFRITNAEGGAAFTVHVIPKATVNGIMGLEKDTVKVQLVAPAGEGANESLVDFLADKLKTDTNHVEIVAGHDQNKKVVIVLNLPPAEVEKRLFS